MFEKATRLKLRFSSIRGDLSTEQLWDLPLQSKTGFDLDIVAKGVNAQLKESAEESFVTEKSPVSEELSLKLDILKHIIAVKLKEREEAKAASQRRAELGRLVEVLEHKKDEALKDLSVEELEARIAALKG
jgi:hypothetical protein